MDRQQPEWKIEAGYGLDREGRAVKRDGTAATLRFYRAGAGDRLRLLDRDFRYIVALYGGGPEPGYIYTYDYEPEENWTVCRGFWPEEGFAADDMIFEKDVYFRIMLERKPEVVPERDKLPGAKDLPDFREILVLERCGGSEEGQAEEELEACFGKEIEDTVRAVQEYCRDRALSAQHAGAAEKRPLVFFLQTDTHCAVGGTWEDTVRTVGAVNEKIRADGYIHLGDVTDGLVPAELTREYVRAVQGDIRALGLPLYYTVGNHDYNYFRNNPEPFGRREMYELYLAPVTAEPLGGQGGVAGEGLQLRGSAVGGNPKKGIKRGLGGQEAAGNGERNCLWYYRDVEERRLRLIFLDSFDPVRKVRYGFPEEELDWLDGVLGQLPGDWYAVVFSHVPPVSRLHYWSSEIRGSQRLTAILRRFQRRSGCRLMGFIHGHNHADQIDLREGFPIISIGCGKCEYFTDKKPEGTETYARVRHTASQELWDALLISTEAEELRFIRFGAGKDRSVSCGGHFGSWQWGEKIGSCQNNECANIRMEARIPMKRVITYGTFDLFHEGHYNLLKRAKALGDYLIVGVTTEHYDEQRGKINIMDSLLERVENVRNSGFADEIIIEDHEGQKVEDIQKYQVDIFTLGSDWEGMFDYLKPYCEVVYLERTPDISSTKLRNSRVPILQAGIVGTGRIAPRFLAEAKYVSGVNVRCAYNPNKKSAQQFADAHALEGYSGSFEEFLDAVDAIYIATPHETHYDYAKRALLKGRHVLCEKPLALSAEEARELFELARERNLVLMEGIKTAYCPGFTQIISIARSGKIGEICDVEACFSRLTAPNLREMIDAEYGGAFLEFGSYTLLPIIKLLGLEYESVDIDSIPADNGVDLYTKIRFRYPGAMAVSKTGIGVKSEGQLLISGTKGYILAESPWWLTRKFQVRYEDPGKIEEYKPSFVGDGLRYEIGDFVSGINGRNHHTVRLTEEETVAMAGIVERFMKKRQAEKQSIRDENRASGVRIWAHRGCSYAFPENTLPAFRAACEVPGITGIELDVQLSKDGQVVIFHDEKVDRLMDAEGYIRDYSLKELREMRFKDWEDAGHGTGGRQPEDICIPTLEDVLRLVKPYSADKNIKINIELKNSVVQYLGMEEKVLALVKQYGMEAYIVYSSFNPESLRRLKSLDPSVETGILQTEGKKCLELMGQCGADALHPHVDGMQEDFADKAGKVSEGAAYMEAAQTKDSCSDGRVPTEMTVRAWNSNEPFYHQARQRRVFRLAELKAKGITDFITNVPEEYL